MTVLAFPGAEKPFAHWLDPVPDESLLSFLFRLDRANGWPPGDTGRLLAVHTTSWRSTSAAEWAAGSRWDLRRLAHLNDCPFEVIEDLTLLPDVRRATNDPAATIAALGDPGELRFCPACLAASGAVPRFCLLPGVLVCPIHDVRMVRFCYHHGTATLPPEVDGDRVRCGGCGAELCSTQGERADAEGLAHLRDVWRAWTFLLGWRGEDIRGRGYRTIRSVRRGYPLRSLGPRPSLEHLVTVFLALQIEPDLIGRLEERPERPCPNATCPRFLPPARRDPLERGRQVERHCSECGARFVGRRILLCFDADHGARTPSPRAVRRAQRRLRRWKLALAEACRQDILAGRPITVTGAFERAVVPANANLRARRLGLVTLVRDAARRQRLLDDREPLPFRTVSMSEYRVIVDAAAHAHWDLLFDCAQLGLTAPNQATPPLRSVYHDRRIPPSYGVLDPLFPPEWPGRSGVELRDLRSKLAGLSQAWRPLSDRWWERAERVENGQVPGPVVRLPHYRTREYGAGPGQVEFLTGEWGPEAMVSILFDRPSPPADPLGLSSGRVEDPGP